MSDAERPLWKMEESVEARAEPAFAFRYLTNIDNMAADPGIDRVETDGPYRVGMHGKTYLAGGGTTDWVVTAVEPDRRFVIDMELRDAFLRFEFRFEERLGGGSVVSQRVSLFGPNASEYREGVAAGFGTTLRDGMRAVRDRVDAASTVRSMDDKRTLLRHFLAALAYRTQKALRDAPARFDSFSAGEGLRTPAQLVRHMTSVLGFARTFFIGGKYWPDPLPTFPEEIQRFHDMLQDLSGHLKTGTPLQGISPERLLQGPFSDAMSHAGQLAMLRRLAQSPVAPEDFSLAEIDPERVGREQADPVSPDEDWPEAPAGWMPPSRKDQSA
jgi:hypothetical protein